jgi:MFS family permease
MQKGTKWWALAGACTGYGLDAVDFMILSLALPLIITDWGLTLAQAGAIASSTMLGAAVGSFLIWGPITDLWGRRKTLAVCLFWFGAISVACGFAQNFFQLAILRFLCGLGLGGEWAIGATLVAEFFPSAQRAKATGFVQSFWAIGYAVAVGIMMLLVPHSGWAGLFWGGGIALFGGLFIWIFVPESPVWLAHKSQNKTDSATKASGVRQTYENVKYLFSKGQIKVLVLCTLLYTFIMTSYWGSGTWIPAYLATVRGMNVKTMSNFLLWYSFFGFLGYNFGGLIADKMGRKASFIFFPAMAAIFTIVWITQSVPGYAFVAGMIFTFFNHGMVGPFGAFVAENFNVKQRGLALAIISGTARSITISIPYIIGAIADATNLTYAIGTLAILYLSASITTVFMKETKHMAIDDQVIIEGSAK